MKKYFIILPGFGETGKEKPYKELSKYAVQQGYIVHIVKIQWDFRILSQWIIQVEKYLEEKHIESEKAVLFGFSFGAEVAFHIAKNKTFKQLLLASISPYFSENLKYIPKESSDFFGIRRMNDFKKYSYRRVLGIKNSNTLFFFGENDWEIGISTAKKIAKSNNANFIIIPKTGHELTQGYIQIVKNKMR